MTPSTVPTASAQVTPRTFQTQPGDHRFFTLMAVISAVAIVGGFSNTYLPKVVNGVPPLPPIIHLHAAVFASWLVLFVAQTTLVLTGRTAVHRRLGVAGVTLAGLMLVVGTETAITSARLEHRGIPGVEFPDAEGFLLLNLAAIVVFATLVGAGYLFRSNIHAHKRLMLMATVGGLVGPGVSRLPFASGRPAVIAVLVLAFLAAGPIYDVVTRRRVHPVYVWSALVALMATPPVVTALSATAAWRGIAAWLLR